jgi:hypothetical protein
VNSRKPSAKNARALAQAKVIREAHAKIEAMADRSSGASELEVYSSGEVQLYGAFVGGSDHDCQNYTKSIKLQGVRIVDEQWLLKLVGHRDQLLTALDKIADTMHDWSNSDAAYMATVAREAIAAAKGGAV